jgi:carbon-monoxide dehydrogenase small subunit
MTQSCRVKVEVNGVLHEVVTDTRTNLGDFLRHTLGLKGTHLGCEHGVCGACTVLIDGASARSCLMLAVQANGTKITTVEGLAQPDGTLNPLQNAFWEHHALQCGFCTPGVLITITELLGNNPRPSEEDVRHAISGNLCRCTGYQSIVDAVLSLTH